MGNRMLLFATEYNKRHLWRSLRCDPTTNRAHCVGIMTVEVPDSVCADGSYFDSHSLDLSPCYPDSCLSSSVLPTRLLETASYPKKPGTSLELALLYCAYPERTTSRPRQIPQTSMNLAKMNLVAGVTHLSSLGIVEFPLFGIAIEGSVGTVICAWCGPLKVENQIQSVRSCYYIYIYIYWANHGLRHIEYIHP